MSNVNLFEQASRLKVRFETNKGSLSVEDLWDLPLTSATGKANLDAIAVDLHKKANEASISFVEARSSSNKELELKLNVVKHVIEVRMAEAKARSEESERSAKKQLILQAIAQKEQQNILDMPLDELKALAGSL